jgi:hypothetical protein
VRPVRGHEADRMRRVALDVLGRLV